MIQNHFLLKSGLIFDRTEAKLGKTTWDGYTQWEWLTFFILLKLWIIEVVSPDEIDNFNMHNESKNHT